MTFALGVSAALAGPLVMTLGFIAWDNHWKGSAFGLNLYKCNLASLGFLILVCTTRPEGPFPSDVFTIDAMGYMFLSSTIGILIGDWTWLETLQLLGARRVILMDSLKPFLAALFGWLILDEKLRPAAMGGIVLTVFGVLLVSLETTSDEPKDEQNKDQSNNNEDNKSHNDDEPDECESGKQGDERNTKEGLSNSTQQFSVDDSIMDELSTVDDKVDDKVNENPKRTRRDLRRGYPYAILNVVLDTYGAVLIKQHGKAFTVWEINFLRFGFAGVVMLLVSMCMSIANQFGQSKDLEPKSQQWYSLPFADMTRSSWINVTVGVALVTFATPTLTNYALFQIALALALTLGSIGPLYSIPLTYLLQHDRPTLCTLLGALLAVAGVAILAWKGTLPDDG